MFSFHCLWVCRVFSNKKIFLEINGVCWAYMCVFFSFSVSNFFSLVYSMIFFFFVQSYPLDWVGGRGGFRSVGRSGSVRCSKSHSSISGLVSIKNPRPTDPTPDPDIYIVCSRWECECIFVGQEREKKKKEGAYSAVHEVFFSLWLQR